MHKPIKYLEKALTYAAGAAWAVFDQVNQIAPNPAIHAEVVRQAAAEVVGEGEAAARAGRARPIRSARSAFRRSASRFSTASRPFTS